MMRGQIGIRWPHWRRGRWFQEPELQGHVEERTALSLPVDGERLLLRSCIIESLSLFDDIACWFCPVCIHVARRGRHLSHWLKKILKRCQWWWSLVVDHFPSRDVNKCSPPKVVLTNVNFTGWLPKSCPSSSVLSKSSGILSASCFAPRDLWLS